MNRTENSPQKARLFQSKPPDAFDFAPREQLDDLSSSSHSVLIGGHKQQKIALPNPELE